MFERLRDKSGLNRTFALQALVDLSAKDAALRAQLTPILQDFLKRGTPAMKARARKLIKTLAEKNKHRQTRSRKGRKDAAEDVTESGH